MNGCHGTLPPSWTKSRCLNHKSVTMPLSRDEFTRTIEAAQNYNPKSLDAAWRRQRAVAMLLLLRWSGLRISDAAKLERSKTHRRWQALPAHPKDRTTRLCAPAAQRGQDAPRTPQPRKPALLLLERQKRCRNSRQGMVENPEEDFQNGRHPRCPPACHARYLRRGNAVGQRQLGRSCSTART